MQDWRADSNRTLYSIQANRKRQRVILASHLGVFAVTTWLAANVSVGLFIICLWMLWAGGLVIHAILFFVYEVVRHDEQTNLQHLLKTEDDKANASNAQT